MSTTDENMTDPEYNLQIGDITEQMNLSFRCKCNTPVEVPRVSGNRLSRVSENHLHRIGVLH